MSLEVDGRPGRVPILNQREGEGFLYTNEETAYEEPSHAQNLYSAGKHEAPAQPQQLSKPKDPGQGGRFRVRPVIQSYWAILFALVLVLAVAAAGVAGSLAAKRGKHVDKWFAFSFHGHALPVYN